MSKIILVSQVASLSKDFEKQEHMRRKSGKATTPSDPADFHDENLDVLLNSMQDDATSAYTGYNSRPVEQINGRVIDSDDRHPLTGSLSSDQRMKIVQLLGAWEEPTIAEQGNVRTTPPVLLFDRTAGSPLSQLAHSFLLLSSILGESYCDVPLAISALHGLFGYTLSVLRSIRDCRHA
jgi:hypothetical protein